MTKIISDTPYSLISEKETGNKRVLDFLLSPMVLIRFGAILSFILTIGHLSGYPWTASQNPGEKQLVTSMKSVDLVFAGERSSYWNLYFGWGIYVAVLLLALAIVLWFLSDIARVAPRRVGIVIQVICASCLVEAYLSFRFFYIPAFLLSSAIFLILQAAVVRLMKRN